MSLKQTIKHSLLTGMKTAGCFSYLKQKNRRKPLVLCFHSVVRNDTPNDPRANIAVTESQFDCFLDFIKKHFLFPF